MPAKADVVALDERETTACEPYLTMVTPSRMLRADAGYGTYLHGEAVAIGMHMAAVCARMLGRVDTTFVDRQRALLENLHLPIQGKGHDPLACRSCNTTRKCTTEPCVSFCPIAWAMSN